jgi:tetratricopeptide (TPR) repeat protein
MQDKPDETPKDSATDEARRSLQSGDLVGALSLARSVLARDPAEPEALYIAAVCLRHQSQPDEALKLLDQLLVAQPGYGRAFQELGYCRRTMGQADLAIAAFERATGANPALVASWNALAELQEAAGKSEKGAAARGQAKWLSGLPRELVSVISFLHEGKLFKAERLCRAFLQANGHHFEAMRLLAEIGVRAHAMEEAEFLLESCAVLRPDYLPARFDYIKLLNKRQKFEQALQEAEAIRDIALDSPQFKLQYANQHLAVGNFEQALALYDELRVAVPSDPIISLTHGHALKTVGRQEEAVAAYRGAYGLRHDLGDAYWSLANLKTYRFSDDEIIQMRTAEAATETSLFDRYSLCFALGKALEDAGQYAESFAYYDRGNHLKREELNYSSERMHADLKAQAEFCTPELFAAHRGAGCPAPDPIFIVGLPRAGSTLLEQILASHSQVEGTMELPNILALAHRLDGRRRVDDEPLYPGNLAELSDDDLSGFGEAFIRDTAVHRRGKAFFIDKMPNNFRHIGLIHLILPNAKIIDARRDPMACPKSVATTETMST